MNRALLFIFTVFFFATACTKKSVVPEPTNSVIINGKAYNTVVIGNQTWTAQNYDGPGGIVNPKADESIYGKYYTVEEMNAVLLPKGWRVPTKTDFKNLIEAECTYKELFSDSIITIDSLSSNHLRSTKNWLWNGDNLSGFNATPAGVYSNYSSKFFYFRTVASYWSSTPAYPNLHYQFWVSIPEAAEGVTPIGGQLDYEARDPYNAMSLRFVKDNYVNPNLVLNPDRRKPL